MKKTLPILVLSLFCLLGTAACKGTTPVPQSKPEQQTRDFEEIPSESDCPDGTCPNENDCPDGTCPNENDCPDGTCPEQKDPLPVRPGRRARGKRPQFPVRPVPPVIRPNL